MTVLQVPATRRPDRFGGTGWAHWGTSAAHLYAWEHPTVSFSVDAYKGQTFDAQRAVDFRGEIFSADEIVAKEF
ncbi:MAG: hypothetical protein ACLPVY_04735 [Acidimicrobiia bacterium]